MRAVSVSAVPLTRRRLLGVAGASLAAAATWPRGAGAWGGGGADDWPMAARDLAGTRAAPEGVALRGRAAPSVRWRAALAGGVPGAAAVVDTTVVAASLGGEVAAFDLRTGRERWRVALPSASKGFFAGPAVAQGRVVVASDHATALDLRTGRVLWAAPPLGALDGDDSYFWGPPTIAGPLALIGSGSGSERPVTRGRLTAYNLNNGRPVWSTPTVPPGANGGGVIAPPTVAGGRVLVATGAPYQAIDGANPGTASLLELRLADGRITWADQLFAHDTLGRDLNSAPVLLGPRAFVTAKDGVHAWDRTTRRRLWSTAITPAPDGHAGPTDGPEFGPLATDGRRLYALSNDGARGVAVAAALDPATGRILWRADLAGFAFAAPALAGGQLWSATADGTLQALRTADGAPLAAVALGEPSAGAVSAAGGLVLAGTGAAPDLPGASLVCVGPG